MKLQVNIQQFENPKNSDSTLHTIFKTDTLDKLYHVSGHFSQPFAHHVTLHIFCCLFHDGCDGCDGSFVIQLDVVRRTSIHHLKAMNPQLADSLRHCFVRFFSLILEIIPALSDIPILESDRLPTTLLCSNRCYLADFSQQFTPGLSDGAHHFVHFFLLLLLDFGERIGIVQGMNTIPNQCPRSYYLGVGKRPQDGISLPDLFVASLDGPPVQR
jgi:hypothetical protein